jgi:hypothetical protein
LTGLGGRGVFGFGKSRLRLLSRLGGGSAFGLATVTVNGPPGLGCATVCGMDTCSSKTPQMQQQRGGQGNAEAFFPPG